MKAEFESRGEALPTQLQKVKWDQEENRESVSAAPQTQLEHLIESGTAKRPAAAPFTSRADLHERGRHKEFAKPASELYSAPVTTGMDMGFTRPPDALGRADVHYAKTRSAETRYRESVVLSGHAL